MLPFSGRAILLDIEGTVSPLSFVQDVLYPYARQELAEFLKQHWDDADVVRAREQVARDAGKTSYREWCGSDDYAATLPRLRAEIFRLMDGDVKATGLKELQGLIWRAGFESGRLKALIFPDVPPALAQWTARGLDLRIYSSGSVTAQKLFFKHTALGDLSGWFKGHYDTTSGGKRDAGSYATIAAAMQRAPAEIMFLSDVAAELDAARAAGVQTAIVLRPGNQPQPAHTHPAISFFDQIEAEMLV